MTSAACEKAIEIIRSKGGMIRTADAIQNGIHPRTLYALRDNGTVEMISRGVYRLAELAAISNPDLVTVASRVPNAVICLISALSFHDLTTQIPHVVSIAIQRDSRSPRIDYPPISVHQFSSESYAAGIDKHEIDGVLVKIYNPEKTIVDCFKFRNRIGTEVVLEAIKTYRSRQQFNLEKLFTYAKICRVKSIMTPYLEAAL
ncbi:type IV toxin-antitoxin system AbiEi family antitoxin domain-containing protein [bacterium]|nr:type IV toxin-antitoxin system AbiEi family antitoxin domain-containing protein [bacterium]RQV95784.1 MAG: transcriptional regulator [bacterium]